MNMQQIMQQAQKMQRDIAKTKEEINSIVFSSEKSLVKVEMFGNRKLKSVKIKSDIQLNSEDIEAIEDMIVIAINDCLNQIEKETESKMGKYGSALNGLI